jgi:hypothetical protein
MGAPFTALAIALFLHDPTSQQAPLNIKYCELVVLHRLHGVHGQDVLATPHQLPHPLQDAFEHQALLSSILVGITRTLGGRGEQREPRSGEA